MQIDGNLTAARLLVVLSKIALQDAYIKNLTYQLNGYSLSSGGNARPREGKCCTAGEALELFQLARLAVDQFAELQRLFPEQVLTPAVSKLMPVSYVSTSQITTNADNLLTDIVSHSSAITPKQISNLSDIGQVKEWGDAPDSTVSRERRHEIALLRHWIEEGYRLIGI